MSGSLVIRLAGLGDIVHLIPALRSLKAFYPNEKLALVCMHPLEQVIPPELDLQIFNTAQKNTLNDLLKLVLKIKKERFSRLFDFYGNPTSAYISILSGIKERYGFNYRVRNLAYTKTFTQQNKTLHQSLLFCDFLEHFGVRTKSGLPNLKPQKDSLQKIDKLGLAFPDFLLAINPNASYQSKSWPLEYFISFINLWYKHTSLPVLLTSAPNEKETSLKIIESVGSKKAFLHSALPLPEFIALLSRADLFLTADTGPMNIAWGLNVPTVALFGPTTYQSVAPTGDAHLVLFKGECRACHKEYCKHKECMYNMTPEWVLKKIIDKYGERINECRIIS